MFGDLQNVPALLSASVLSELLEKLERQKKREDGIIVRKLGVHRRPGSRVWLRQVREMEGCVIKARHASYAESRNRSGEIMVFEKKKREQRKGINDKREIDVWQSAMQSPLPCLPSSIIPSYFLSPAKGGQGLPMNDLQLAAYFSLSVAPTYRE